MSLRRKCSTCGSDLPEGPIGTVCTKCQRTTDLPNHNEANESSDAPTFVLNQQVSNTGQPTNSPEANPLSDAIASTDDATLPPDSSPPSNLTPDSDSAFASEKTTAEPPSADDDRTIVPSSDTAIQVAAGTGKIMGSQSAGIPREFGPYVLESEIARGGMGVVYKARQKKLRRVVALKMILAGQLASQQDVQRFQTEAESAAQLNHVGIVPIHEVGEIDGQHFFSMGFVDGPSLADKISAGPMSPRVAAAYTKKISEAIFYAHQEGVIHRDLKPSNVLLDGNDEPKVTDFGLAKQVEGDSGLTATGQILGTPSYMPPEQASGDVNDVGVTSDVYSLGAILYALVTGRPPFQAATAVDTIMQVMDQDPVSPRSMNAHLPVDLETICLKCLEKEPHRRYASADELAKDLGRFLSGEPISARPTSRTERFAKWVRRRPMVAALAGVIALVTLLGFAGVTSQWFRAEKNLQTAKEESERATRESDARLAALDRLQQESDARKKALQEKQSALEQKNRAFGEVERQRDRAERLYLTGQASSLLSTNPSQALLLALEGSKRAPSELTNNVILKALASHREIHVLESFGDQVRRVLYSPDGKIIAAAGDTGAIRLFDAESGKCVARMVSPERAATDRFQFSADGKFLAQALENGAVNLWETGSTRLVGRITDHRKDVPVSALAFSPDSSKLLTAAQDGTTRLWNAMDASAIGDPLVVSNCGVGAACFSRDGKHVLATSDGHENQFADDKSENVGRSQTLSPTVAAIFETETGDEIAKIEGLNGPIDVAKYSPNGKQFLLHSKNGVQLYNAKTHLPVEGSAFKTTQAAVDVDCVFLTDGEDVTASSDFVIQSDPENGIRKVDLKTGETVQRFAAARPGVIGISSDGLMLAARITNSAQLIGVWDIRTGNRLMTLTGHSDLIESLSFRPNSNHLVSGAKDGTARVWNLGFRYRLGDFVDPRQLGDVTSIGLTPDGQRVLVLRGKDRVSLVDIATAKASRKMSFRVRPPTFGTFARNFVRKMPITFGYFTGSGQIVCQFSDGAVNIWDRATKKFVTLSGLSRSKSEMFGISHQGDRLAYVKPDSKFHVVDASNGSTIRAWPDRKINSKFQPTFTPDQTAVLILENDNRLDLLDIETGESRFRSRFNTPNATQVLFSPDGRSVFLAKRFGGAVLLDTFTGLPRLDLPAEEKKCQATFFANSDRLLLLHSGQLGIWNTKTGNLEKSFPGQEYVDAIQIGDEQLLALSRDGMLASLNMETAVVTETNIKPSLRVTGICASHDGASVATILLDGSCVIWNSASGQARSRFEPPEGQFVLASFGSDDKELLTLTTKGAAALWDTSTSKLVQPLEKVSLGGSLENMDQLFWSREYFTDNGGARLLHSSNYTQPYVEVWDTAKRKRLVRVSTNFTRANRISPDGKTLVVVKAASSMELNDSFRRGVSRASLAVNHKIKGSPTLIDVDTGKIKATLDIDGEMSEVLFSRDSQRMMARGFGHVSVVDVSSGSPIAHQEISVVFRGMAFSHDAQQAMIIRSDGVPFLWDLKDNQLVELADGLELDHSTGFALNGRFTSDGKQLAIAYQDRTVRFWDTTTGQILGSLPADRHAVRFIRFSDDGLWMATAAESTVRIWRSTKSQERRSENGTPFEAWVEIPHENVVADARFHGGSLVTISRESLRPYIWPLDLPSFAAKQVQRSMTLAERDRFRLETADEPIDLKSDAERLNNELDLALTTLNANLSNRRAQDFLTAKLRDIQEFITSHPDSVEAGDCMVRARAAFKTHRQALASVARHVARIQEVAGDIKGAIRTLEQGLDQSASLSNNAQRVLAELRMKLRPDLASFASVDALANAMPALIPEKAEWRYFKGVTPPSQDPLGWAALRFDDQSWPVGRSGFGYGDDDDETILTDMRDAYSSLYVRREFEVEDPTEFQAIVLKIRIDDGFVAYCNGKEIGRQRAGPKGTPLTHTSVATLTTDYWVTHKITIDNRQLRVGVNVIAIHGLNASNSSDFTLDASLSAESGTTNRITARRFETLKNLARSSGSGTQAADEQASDDSAAAAPDSAAIEKYFQARLNESTGKISQAIDLYRELMEEFPKSSEPVVSIARCLSNAGQTESAYSMLKKAMQQQGLRSNQCWSLWHELIIVLRYDADRILEELAAFGKGRRSPGVVQLRTALNMLRTEQAIRVNSGATTPYTDYKKRVWERDQFFVGGLIGKPRYRNPLATRDFTNLFVTERYFPRDDPNSTGYRIPLAPGKYKILLHFAEVHWKTRNLRVFDVFVEEKRVKRKYEPLAAGYGIPEQFEFPVNVQDGFLDVRFHSITNNAKLSMFEIIQDNE